jgi:hypothetical protein
VRFAFASALAAAIVLLILWIAPPSSIYIATKGPPTITVFVKQNELVARWDGRAPVKPGDSLRLQIGANDYHHASIALLNPTQEPGQVLWSGPLPADGALLLPVSFRVDEQGTEEILSLVLGHNPISPNLHRKPDDSQSETTTWRQILVIPKSALPEKSSP